MQRIQEHPLSRQIIHLDMDAFFAAVEQRDNAAIRRRPVIVGGPSKRGVVSTASYEARKFGVRSAMSMVEALRRCPTAIVLPPRHSHYAEVSNQVFEIFKRFTPLVEGLSLDEAFLDVTESYSLFGDGETIAKQIKALIHNELHLTASAGVAPSKFVAKIASDLRKPDGLVVVLQGEIQAFLDPLPIERMWGVGPQAASKLRSHGFATIGDLAKANPARLTSILGQSWGLHIHALAQGLDDRFVNPERAAQSIGAEETFEQDLRTRHEIEVRLLGQASRIAQRLLHACLFTRSITLKIKYADFSITTRRTTLSQAIADTDSIYQAALSLLDRIDLNHRSVRLTGLSASNLTEQPSSQIELFGDNAPCRRHQLEQVVAKVSDKFGEKGIIRASLLEIKTRATHKSNNRS